jgi:hypothetical protein
MTKYKSLLIRVLSTFAISAICYGAYIVGDLESIFGKSIDYIQWLMISLIVLALYPTPISSKNDSKGS